MGASTVEDVLDTQETTQSVTRLRRLRVAPISCMAGGAEAGAPVMMLSGGCEPQGRSRSRALPWCSVTFPVAVAIHVGLFAPITYSGIAGQTSVAIPRLDDAAVTIDGDLGEPSWSHAATLTGFSEYTPVDGRPAEDSTAVLVWYSPTAMYFGIRAFETHGPVHATLADRDRIGTDDYVQILLDTFDDHRQALVFGVNPFGMQSDGTLTETLGGSRDTVDRSADFVFQSKGRVTGTGYEVEIRIPFKSIHYQQAGAQGSTSCGRCSTPGTSRRGPPPGGRRRRSSRSRERSPGSPTCTATSCSISIPR